MAYKSNHRLFFKGAFWVVYLSLLVLLLVPGIYELSLNGGPFLFLKILGVTFELLVLTGILLSLLNIQFGAIRLWKLVHGVMVLSVVVTMLTGLFLLYFVDSYVGMFTLVAGMFLIPAQWRLYIFSYQQFSDKDISDSGIQIVLSENIELAEN